MSKGAAAPKSPSSVPRPQGTLTGEMVSGSNVLGDELLTSGARRACLLPTSSVTVSLSRFLVPSTIGALGDSCRPGGEGVINVRLGTRAALWGWPNNKGQHARHTWGICMGQCWRLLMVSATVSSWREPSHLSLRPGLRPGQDQMALRERDS